MKTYEELTAEEKMEIFSVLTTIQKLEFLEEELDRLNNELDELNSDMDETSYLLAAEENAIRLEESIAQIKSGKFRSYNPNGESN